MYINVYIHIYECMFRTTRVGASSCREREGRLYMYICMHIILTYEYLSIYTSVHTCIEQRGWDQVADEKERADEMVAAMADSIYFSQKMNTNPDTIVPDGKRE